MAFALVGALGTAPVQADTATPDISQELSLFDSTEGSLDPLGLDPEVGAGLDSAAARLKPATTPPPPLRRGATLTAIEPVTERLHELALRWEAGLMHVSVQIVLDSTSPLPALFSYRLPLPPGSVVTRVAACAGETGSCREAIRGGSDAAAAQSDRDQPALDAQPIHDERGQALALSGGPVRAGGPLRLEVGYVAEAPVFGGEIHFALPPRGEDPGLVEPRARLRGPAEVRFDADTSDAAAVPFDDRVRGLSVHGTVVAAGPAPVRLRAPCGAGSCLREYEVLPFRAAPVRTTWLWLDASPSMEGLARNRADRVLASLLGSLPEATPLVPTAFAAKSRALARDDVAHVTLRSLSDALSDDLGAASHLRELVHQALPELRRTHPRIVILSDGKLDPGDDAAHALGLAAQAGAEVWLVDLAGFAPPLPHVHVLALADADQLSEAALAARLRGISALHGRSGPTGEARIHERRPARLRVEGGTAHTLAAWLARDDPAPSFRLRGALSDPTRRALLGAPPYADVAPPAPAAHTGMPKESVLSMLRTQLVPRARACLRSDRRGRADYAVALTFEAEFADREVYDARVLGALPRPLSACLDALLPTLRVPSFSGRVRVRYPIHTERELVPEAVELSGAELGQLEQALRTELRVWRRRTP